MYKRWMKQWLSLMEQQLVGKLLEPVSVVKAEEFKGIPSANIANLLQGQCSRTRHY